MKSSALDDLQIKEGQRVMLIRAGPPFGSAREAEAFATILSLDGMRGEQQHFEELLHDVGLSVGSEGTVEIVFLTGYAKVKFDDYERPLDIPTHCLLPINKTEG